VAGNQAHDKVAKCYTANKFSVRKKITMPLKIISQLKLPGLDEAIARIAPNCELHHIDFEQKIDDDLRADVLLTIPFNLANTEQLLLPKRGLRWIHLLGTGADHFPLKLTGEAILSCSRGASAIPISEWVMACALSHVKQLPSSWIHEVPGSWNTTFQLQSLNGKKMAILGFGGIGQALAQRALPFGLSVSALTRNPRPLDTAGVTAASSAEELITDADFLVLAAPATKDTFHWLNSTRLAQMKPGACLINVARGSLVDQDALRVSLDSGQLSHAYLDAVDPEPLPEQHWLYQHPKVSLSPHVSWSEPQSFDRLLDGFYADLENYINDRALAGLVDKHLGY
jgi:phosphoglycerate dehydrogenase-like enzyme